MTIEEMKKKIDDGYNLYQEKQKKYPIPERTFLATQTCVLMVKGLIDILMSEEYKLHLGRAALDAPIDSYIPEKEKNE